MGTAEVKAELRGSKDGEGVLQGRAARSLVEEEKGLRDPRSSCDLFSLHSSILTILRALSSCFPTFWISDATLALSVKQSTGTIRRSLARAALASQLQLATLQTAFTRDRAWVTAVCDSLGVNFQSSHPHSALASRQH